MFFFKYRFLILFMMINVIHGKTPGHSDYRDFDGRPLLELIPTLSNHNVGDIESQISSLTPDHDQISSKVKEQQTKGEIEIRGRAGASILEEMNPQYGGPFVYPVELEMDRVIAKQQTRMGFKNLFSFFDKTKKDFLHDVTGIFDPILIFECDAVDKFKSYLSAANNGDLTCILIMAIINHVGIKDTLSKNESIAKTWYLEAIKHDSLLAHYNLALLYQNAYSPESIKHFQIAAEGGHVKAMFMLAESYRFGIGVANGTVTEKVENENIALKWYKRAAKRGSKRAKERTNHHAEVLAEERNKFNNYREVVQSNKSVQGKVMSALGIGQDISKITFLLAECYYYGRGTEIDKERAKKLYKKAKKIGSADAEEALNRID